MRKIFWKMVGSLLLCGFVLAVALTAVGLICLPFVVVLKLSGVL